MEKSATLNLRINPILKNESIDITKMNEEQIHAKIQRGYDDYKAGRVQNAATAFAKFQESHS